MEEQQGGQTEQDWLGDDDRCGAKAYLRGCLWAFGLDHLPRLVRVLHSNAVALRAMEGQSQVRDGRSAWPQKRVAAEARDAAREKREKERGGKVCIPEALPERAW